MTQHEIKQVNIRGGYEIRDDIKSAGGRWHGAAKQWEMSPAAWATLCERALESSKRSNKRDTHLAREIVKCRIEIVTAAGGVMEMDTATIVEG